MTILRLLILCASLWLSACSPKLESENQPQTPVVDKPANTILGKWSSSQNTNGTIRFLEDGVLVAEADGQVQAGKFRFLTGDFFEIQIGEHIQIGTISFISSDEVLLVATNTGTAEILKRVSE